jgi:hypothetical protein
LPFSFTWFSPLLDEKVIMIADEGIMEIVKNEKQPDSTKAQLRAERSTGIYSN